MKVLSCRVAPQHVGTGKPNMGFEKPLGIGAGVVCRAASLAARERPVPVVVEEEEEDEEEEARRSRKSVARKNLVGEERRGPWAWERGVRWRLGVAAWRALREACSPWGSVLDGW